MSMRSWRLLCNFFLLLGPCKESIRSTMPRFNVTLKEKEIQLSFFFFLCIKGIHFTFVWLLLPWLLLKASIWTDIDFFKKVYCITLALSAHASSGYFASFVCVVEVIYLLVAAIMSCIVSCLCMHHWFCGFSVLSVLGALHGCSVSTLL